MEALKIILTVVYIVVCLALILITLLQESKDAGLSGAIAGGAGTYWSKNKGRSKEGKLNKATVALGLVFGILSVVLNLSIMQ